MNYQVSFIENPPEARITVNGKEGCVMLSRTVPITESTTTAELHDVGLLLVIEQEKAFADYEAKQVEEVAKVARVQELKVAIGDNVEITEKELEEKKAEIAAEEAKLQAIEDERIAKEAAEVQAIADAEAARITAEETIE